MLPSHYHYITGLCILIAISTITSFGAIIEVTTVADSGAGSLREAIDSSNSLGGSNTILFNASLSGQTIALQSALAPIRNHLIIDGTTLGITINPESSSPVFFLRNSVDSSPIEIRNLAITNARARGGDGGLGGGGGGGGLGGALFVRTGVQAIVQATTFSNCSAIGGDGGSSYQQVFLQDPQEFVIVQSGGGGGGLGGNGGNLNGGGGGGYGGSGGSLVRPVNRSHGGGGGGGLSTNGGDTFSNFEIGEDRGGGGGGGGNALLSGLTSIDVNGSSGASLNGAGGGGASGNPDIGVGGNGDGTGQDGQDASPTAGGNGGVGGFGGGGGGGGAGNDTSTSGSGGNGGEFAGGGGGAASEASAGLGGDGGFGGGGGAGGGLFDLTDSSCGTGGDGGFGGGGGGGGGATLFIVDTASNVLNAQGGNGGNGGFAGGGGAGGLGTIAGTAGTGGFGGGDGGIGGSTMGTPNLAAGGGGGAGFGGAIFIEDGASLTIENGSFENNLSAGGAGGNGVDSGGPGLALGQDIFLMSGGSVTFNLSSDLSVPNPIESDQNAGSGGLMKQGSATLFLNGVNTYTGSTIVNTGALILNGSLITDVMINNGGVFGGNATVNGSVTSNGGTLSPGNSIGTITITGDYSQDASASLEIEINAAGQSDLVDISGTASLAGTLNVFPETGTYLPGTTYTIIQAAGGVSGTFTTVSTGGVPLQVNYFPSMVQLLVIGLSPIPPSDLSGNARSIYACLQQNAEGDFAQVISELITLNSNEFNSALNQMAPTQVAAFPLVNLEIYSAVFEMLANPFSEHFCSIAPCPSETERSAVWIQPFGLHLQQKQVQELVGLSSMSWGAVAGLDHCFRTNSSAGAVLGYAHTNIDYKKERGTSKVDNYFGGVYLGFSSKYVLLDLSAIIGINEYDMHRNIIFADIDRTADSSHLAGTANVHLGLLLSGGRKRLQLQPFAHINYFLLYEEGYDEHNASSLNLSTSHKSSQYIEALGGFRIAYTLRGSTYCVSSYVEGALIYKNSLSNGKVNTQFEDALCKFNLSTVDRSFAGYSADAAFVVSRRDLLSLLFGYHLEKNNKQFIQQATAKLQYRF